MLATWKESYDKPKQCVKKQRHRFTNKICIIRTMVFLGVVYRCDSWTRKKTEHQRTDDFQVVLLEKTLESHLDCKEQKPANPKGNQP